MTELSKCPLCSSEKLSLKHEFDSGLGLTACDDCGFVFTSPRLDPKDVSQRYSEGYFNGSGDSNMSIDYTSNSEVFMSDARERVKIVSRYLPGRRRILEVGSAAGYFLKACADSGFYPVGIEVSREMCEYAESKLGVKCINADFLNFDFEDAEQFSAVAMWHCLEHLENPSAVIARIKTLITKGGWIFITVPNIESGNSRRFGCGWKHLEPEVHMNHFSAETLSRLLIDNGFMPVSKKRTGGTGMLGRESSTPGIIKKIIASNIGLLGFIRRPVKAVMTGMLGRDDFITIVARDRGMGRK